MFFYLSQVFSWLILPFSQILITLGLFLFLKHPQWKKVARYAFFTLFILYTSPLTSGLILRLWEVPATPLDEVEQVYDVGIVLGGMSNLRAVPDDRPHFFASVDRITDAITLYKRGRIQKILISGGSGYLLRPELIESQRLKDFCILMGVPAEDIYLESESRNTRQNAVNSMQMIEERWPEARYLLITSATHMRRSLGCFRKAGGNPDAFSTDINSTPFDWDFRLLIPHPGAIEAWSTVFREMVGYMIYWVVGYI